MAEEVRLTPEQRNSLVAYLDRELSESETAEIEDALGRSQTARREVEVLSRTWEALDVLDRPGASRDFTSRTIELVKSDALRGEALRSKLTRSARRSIVAVLCAAGIVAAAVVGFLTTRVVWPDPNRLLVEDLPIVENLDLYLDGTRIEFVRQLESYFPAEPAGEAVAPGAPGGQEVDQGATAQPMAAVPVSLDARRQYVRRMSADEFRRLSLNLDRYQELLERDPETRDRLRGLYEQLEADHVAGGDLLNVLRRYHAWLLDLSPGDRYAIRSAPIDGRQGGRRIDAVARQLSAPRRPEGGPGFSRGPGGWDDRQGRDSRSGPPPDGADGRGSYDAADSRRAVLTREDFDAVINWFALVALDERQRAELARLDGRERVGRILRGVHETSDWARRITPEQWDQLFSQLSPQAREELTTSNRPLLRLRGMIGAFVADYVGSGPRVSEAQLDDFFWTLEPADRTDLLQFERRERYRRLEALYRAAHADEQAAQPDQAEPPGQRGPDVRP